MKKIFTVITMVLATVLGTCSISAAPITEIESGRIYSLLQKVDIPDDLRQDIAEQLASEPDLAVSDGDFTTLWYVTKDTVRFGIIPLPAGQGMKQWTFGERIGGRTWYNMYQVVSIDEGRAVGVRVIRCFDFLRTFVIMFVIIAYIPLVVILAWTR